MPLVKTNKAFICFCVYDVNYMYHKYQSICISELSRKKELFKIKNIYTWSIEAYAWNWNNSLHWFSIPVIYAIKLNFQIYNVIHHFFLYIFWSEWMSLNGVFIYVNFRMPLYGSIYRFDWAKGDPQPHTEIRHVF